MKQLRLWAVLGTILCCCSMHGTQGKRLLTSDKSQSAAVVTAAEAAAAGSQLRQQQLKQQQLSSGPGYAVSRPMFVLFGDSITEFGWLGPSWEPSASGPGWATQLAQYYSRKADVVNRGMSGWNSRWARRALPTTLQQLIPAVDYDKEAQKAAALVACGAPWLPRLQLLVIWFGANDATLPTGKDGALSVPVDEFKSNLAAMVQAARAAGVPNILLITPTPVNEAAWAKRTGQKSSDRTNDQVKLYAQAIRDVGAKQGVPVLDLHALVNALPADKKAAWAFDGLHPSPEGQTMVFNAIKDALDNWQQFSSLRQWSLPIQWPAYNNINYMSPNQTFDELLEKQRVCST